MNPLRVVTAILVLGAWIGPAVEAPEVSARTLAVGQTYTVSRGRVKMVNNTLVADNGALLRGANGYSSDWKGDYDGDPNWWIDLRDNFKLNTVRIMVDGHRPPDSTGIVDLDWLFGQLDKDVNNAKRAGMYVILCLYLDEGFSSAISETVWGRLAPRYKDHTHVIYEQFNEPVHGRPAKITDQNRQDQIDLYNYIRARAPDTHIILWSPAHIDMTFVNKVTATVGINYGNTSVGFHPYPSSDLNAIQALRDLGYAVINTEWGQADGETNKMDVWNYCEQNGVSWIFLELDSNQANTGQGVIDPNEWPRTWPADPYYNSASPPPVTPPVTPPGQTPHGGTVHAIPGFR